MKHRPYDLHPPGFRAEDFAGVGGSEDGFLPVSDLARKNGLTLDEAVRAVERQGWQLRAFGDALFYRPAIVTRMGP